MQYRYTNFYFLCFNLSLLLVVKYLDKRENYDTKTIIKPTAIV